MSDDRFEETFKQKRCICSRKRFSENESRENVRRHVDNCDVFKLKKKRPRIIESFFPRSSRDNIESREGNSSVSDNTVATGEGNSSVNDNTVETGEETSLEPVEQEDIVEQSIVQGGDGSVIENLSVADVESNSNTVADPIDINPDVIDEGSGNDSSEGERFCGGFYLFPDKEFYANYPFGVHTEANKHVEAYSQFIPVDGAVYSTKCRNRQFKLSSTSTNSICDDCYSLKTLNSVKGILERSNLGYEDLKSTNNVFLNQKQLVEKLEEQKKCLEKFNLKKFNNEKKLQVLKRKLGYHQRFLVALSEKDGPRLRQLISVCLRQKNGISYILNKLSKAMQNVYSPKG